MIVKQYRLDSLFNASFKHVIDNTDTRSISTWRSSIIGCVVANPNNVIQDSQRFSFSEDDRKTLQQSLWFCKVGELREVLLNQLKINANGTEALSVQRIIHFFATGGAEVLMMPEIPASCRVDTNTRNLPYEPTDLSHYMLAKNARGGIYKIGAVRKFFKQQIGENFSFKMDAWEWMRHRWYAGNAPTYKEFMEKWQQIARGDAQEGAGSGQDFDHPSCCYNVELTFI